MSAGGVLDPRSYPIHRQTAKRVRDCDPSCKSSIVQWNRGCNTFQNIRFAAKE
jgi:hypothetical protein